MKTVLQGFHLETYLQAWILSTVISDPSNWNEYEMMSWYSLPPALRRDLLALEMRCQLCWRGWSRDKCLTGEQMQQCHKHLKVDLFGLTNHSGDPISPIYPSKSLAALTTPVLKGALSKAQKDYWSFVSLLPSTQSTLHTEESWMPCLCHLWAFSGSWLLTCCLVKTLYKVQLSSSDLIHSIFRIKH